MPCDRAWPQNGLGVEKALAKVIRFLKPDSLRLVLTQPLGLGMTGIRTGYEYKNCYEVANFQTITI